MPTNYIDGIPVEFPHTAYPCQITFMESVMKALKNKENALLESPTGTGKTLSLLCAALAWRTAEMGRRQLMGQTSVARSANYDTIMERTPITTGSAFKSINSASGSVARLQNTLNESLNVPLVADNLENIPVDEHIKAPLIIYASRTHSQLTQVIGELRRTTYRPKIAIVGSRDQMCIHPNVKELGSSSAQSAVCNRLTRKKACEFNLRVPEALNHLKRKGQEETASGTCEQTLMDMEDLIEFASQHRACPYYTSRELLSEADLVFMPYNYLLDKKTRGSSLLSFKDAIVIFDEAHNVESSCYEAVSCEISSDDLTQSEKELDHCIEIVDTNFFGSLSVTKDSVIAAKTFVMNLKATLSKFEIPSGTNFLSLPGQEIFNAFEEGQQRNADSGLVEIDMMLGSFEEIVKLYLEDQYNRRSGKKSSFQTIVSALRTIYGMEEKQDDDEEERLNEVQVAYMKSKDRQEKRDQLIKKSNDFYRMVITEQSSSSLGKPNYQPRNTNSIRTMAYWCFSPGVAIRELISMGVRSVVLTSGTLSPMKSFMQEMEIDFKHVLENDHVIDDDQVFATIVGVGPTGKSLNSSFNQRDSKDYQQELGLAIVNFCRVVPDGVLVFFPSYQVMDSCLSYWQICKPGGSSAGNIPGAQTIYQMIQQIKTPVTEPKHKGDLSTAMERYERLIDDPNESRNGAIFFAVCRGKVSEGLDFSDAKGRAVIVTGIPYPPFKDPKIILKKQYLQDQSSKNSNFLSGTEWYNQQASRAVNQALGRVIRHRKDFGAILLCDERFGNAGTIGQLSKWLRGRVNVAASFGEVQGGLARFFKDKPKHIKTSSEAQLLRTPVNPNTSARLQQQASLAKNEIQMQKFKLESPPVMNNRNNSSSILEMFKNSNSQKSETKKFDWFKTGASQENTINSANTQTSTPLSSSASSSDKEKKEKAQEYLELARKTLSKDDFRNFMGLLKTYRAGQIEIGTLLNDLVELLRKVADGNAGRALLEGFETFVPAKHRSLFDEVLKNKSSFKCEASAPVTEDTSEFSDEIKKRKLHSDFVGKKSTISIEPVVLKRKLSNDINSFSPLPLTTTSVTVTVPVTKEPSSTTVSTNCSEPCPICKDILNDPFKAKCNHVACFECWNAWLGRTLECPLCRQRTRVSQLRRLD